MTPSGLTADEIEFLTASIRSDSGLIGLGEVIFRAEYEYGINAYFTLGVASIESGHGRSTAARNRNNLFGVMYARGGLVHYDCKEDSIMAFARLISGSMYVESGRTSIALINPRYAGDFQWGVKVVELMNTYRRNHSRYEPPLIIEELGEGVSIIYEEVIKIEDAPIPHATVEFPTEPLIGDAPVVQELSQNDDNTAGGTVSQTHTTLYDFARVLIYLLFFGIMYYVCKRILIPPQRKVNPLIRI
jgi:hypothetical protein